jgi:hypothetical protein
MTVFGAEVPLGSVLYVRMTGELMDAAAGHA